MNSKKTNLVVTILNVIAVITLYVSIFCLEYIAQYTVFMRENYFSIYNSNIVEFILNKLEMILVVFGLALGIINIICAIQNRNNKKLFFWQVVFGINEIFLAKSLCGVLMNEYYWAELGNSYIFGIVPILFAIKNIFFARKNKANLLQIFSYIFAIMFAVLHLLDILHVWNWRVDSSLWDIVAVIMQLIYVITQERNTQESNARKIVNVILYYIIQALLVVSFFAIVMGAIVSTKVCTTKMKNEILELLNNVAILKDSAKEDIFIPVENNNKYGFINQSGDESIPCEYDLVSFFFEIGIDNDKYYLSLAKSGDEYYIISKSGDKIVLEGILREMVRFIQ